MECSVTTIHLEMTDPAQFRPAPPPRTKFDLVRAQIPCPALNRFLYTAVGADWWWYNRLPWDYARWAEYLDRPELETWVAYVAGTPAGYFELERQVHDNVEIVYFGVMPHFIGKGIGGALLSAAVSRAWEMGAARVWVHTCSLDHPAARGNYEARGFKAFKAEEKIETLSDRPLEPWPGAGTVCVVNTSDERPPVGVAHVVLHTDCMKESALFMRAIGMRPVFDGPEVSVYEMRGGTHLVLMRKDQVAGGDAPFDLMVDDLHATYRRFTELGLAPSPIEARPAIDHEIFTVREPAGHIITVFSSHASGEPV